MFTISHCLVTYSRKFSRTDSYASVWRLKGVIRNHINLVPAEKLNRLGKIKIFVDFAWKWAHKREYEDIKKWHVAFKRSTNFGEVAGE